MTAPVASRRQRLHEATAEEIKAAARALMAAEGTSSLNLRAIARELGMTPSALYRYFASRDAILTALICDAYDAVGEAVEQAVADAPKDGTATAILAGVHAYRRWALEHPQEYGLIYGPPVPGYVRPESPDHDQHAMRTNAALLGELVRALEMGILQLPPDDSIPERIQQLLCPPEDERTLEKELGAHLPIAAWQVAMQFWVVLMGAINAEVFRHLPPNVLNGAAEFFDYTMRRALAVMGCVESAIDAAVSPDY